MNKPILLTSLKLFSFLSCLLLCCFACVCFCQDCYVSRLMYEMQIFCQQSFNVPGHMMIQLHKYYIVIILLCNMASLF